MVALVLQQAAVGPPVERAAARESMAAATVVKLTRRVAGPAAVPQVAAARAAQAAMDPRTLQRRFQRETGLSFGQWRRQARLIAALERLARGASVLEVALDLGYASPSAFSTMFKRELGASPSAFFDVS